MKLFSRMSAITIISTDIPGVLEYAAKYGVALHDVVYLDELSIQAKATIQNVRRMQRDLKMHRKIQGLKINAYIEPLAFFKRSWLSICAITVLLIATVLLPKRILFVNVTGNSIISTKEILNKAYDSGLVVGTRAKYVNRENLKNTLIQSIDGIKWASVSISGCTATIQVSEEDMQEAETYSSGEQITAVRDGIVDEITVVQGTALCQTGDAVKQGQILISGYQDLDRVIGCTKAEGEVFAKTRHCLEVMALHPQLARSGIIHSEKRYSIILGKNLIKLYKDSGIWDTTCVKIRTIKYLKLPGAFSLPVGLLCEERFWYDTEANQGEWDFSWMENSAIHYLTNQMLGGKLLYRHSEFQTLPDGCKLAGTYICREQIGRIKSEEIIQRDTQNN